MDKQKLLQKLQQIKESTKSIMEGGINDGETSTDVESNQDQS